MLKVSMVEKNTSEFVFDSFLDLGGLELDKRVIIGVENFPTHLFGSSEKITEIADKYYKERGSTFFFDYNCIFFYFENNKKISEIRIIDEKDSISFTDDGNILRLKANNKYKNIEYRLKTKFPEKDFIHYENKIHEFEIKNNKFVIVSYMNSLNMDNETFDINENDKTYDCENGTYEVYALIIEHKSNYKNKYNGPPPPYGYSIRRKS